MITTSLNDAGRVIVSDDAITDDTPENFVVCVKNESDWNEIHNYIINVNEIDNIPNRKIDCRSEMKCSPKRGVYEMSVNEANILRNHPKVEWVEQSSLYNPIVLEQRKYDEEFDRLTDAFRFQDTFNSTKFYDSGISTTAHITGSQTPTDCKTEHISHWRKSLNVMAQDSNPEVTYNHDNVPQGVLESVTWLGNDYPVGLGSTNPGIGLTFTQWGLLRHGYKENIFKGGYPGTPTGSLDNEVITDKDVSFSLTGKHVDIVIMDTGVIWNLSLIHI